MMDYAIPPSMIVATSAWSMHPDLSVFTSPDTFLPERWLKCSSTLDRLSTMATYMIPFGTGSGMCGGHNLAQVMFPAVMDLFSLYFFSHQQAPAATSSRSNLTYLKKTACN